jgi:hypothetical protein
VLYLGEINDNQHAAWCKTIEVFQEGQAQPQERAIFPEDRRAPALDCEIVVINFAPLNAKWQVLKNQLNDGEVRLLPKLRAVKVR